MERNLLFLCDLVNNIAFFNSAMICPIVVKWKVDVGNDDNLQQEMNSLK